MSKNFLVAYDYGMGGLWAIIDADSEDGIKNKYPELAIFHDRPKWMTQARYPDLCQNEPHAIKEAPSGILKVGIADREKGAIGDDIDE